MARNFRIKKRANTKGEAFYQIFGPNPKTGKEEYRETVKGSNAKHRAEARVRELVADAYALTDTGKMETRTVAHLAAQYLHDLEERERWTMQTGQWHVKGKSFTPDSMRNARDTITRFIVPNLGPTTLIALELDDIQKMVNRV